MPVRILIFLALALVPSFLGFAGGDPTSLSFALTRESEPYVESVVSWMVRNTGEKLLDVNATRPASDDEVRDYFVAVRKLLDASRREGANSAPAQVLRREVDAAQPPVEAAIQRKVAIAADEEGLGFRLFGNGPVPPVLFKFQSPPNLLVASPRNRIEREATVLLKTRLSADTQEAIEARADSSRVSTLVTAIGGLGVYPSMVPESADPRWTMRTVAHEWTHQFLALRPLGVRYALGDETDPRMITINETVAEVVGTELGDKVFASYYPSGMETPRPGQAGGDSTFRSQMREIRNRVDELLADGKVKEAESYMEQARQHLQEEGFYIRKLNQAYFAFYGSYAEDPAVSGRGGAAISEGIRGLRQRSANLSEFLWRLSDVGSYSGFAEAVSEN